MSWNREITAWPPAMKLSNYSMGLLPWNRQITAWTFYREIIKLQHGPSSAMKSWNYRMDRLAWNRQIIAWANCREIVKLQHGPSTVKSSNCSMSHLPWNREITGWNCQITAFLFKKSTYNHSMSQLPWKWQNLVWLDSVVWIWKIFSVMCFWFFAPTYYVFGLRMHFRWCAFGELRQNINCQNINCLAH